MTTSRPRLRPLLLPTEHGGWGLVGAPVLLGLWVAPSWPGALVGLATLFAFLARQPLRIAVGDLLKRKRYPRTIWAAGFAAAYLDLALISFAAAWWLSEHPFWMPLAVAAPLFLAQAAYDASKQGRGLLPELMGAAGVGAVAPAMLMASGWDPASAWLCGLVLAMQSCTAIVYVRSRLDLAKGKPGDRAWSIGFHLVALGAVAWLASIRPEFTLAVAAFAALACRAWVGQMSACLGTRAAWVGVQEVVFTLVTVASMAIGHR